MQIKLKYHHYNNDWSEDLTKYFETIIFDEIYMIKNIDIEIYNTIS